MFLFMTPHGGTRGEALFTYSTQVVSDTKMGLGVILEVKVRERVCVNSVWR